MGVAAKLAVHNIGTFADGLGMAFRAVTLKTEDRMPWNRFVEMAGIARLLVGMAVGETTLGMLAF
ncbi:MAG TPA: hypothetical protein VGJ93_08265 [Desulfuromonadaceae bacterium]|jgi:hypothetical protein